MNSKTTSALAAGFANPEPDVPLPTRRRSASFQASVVDLEVGEVASQAKLMDGSLPYDELVEAAAQTREGVRNTLSTVVRRAREATGGDYRIEVTDTLTTARKWYVVSLVTRIS